MKIVPILAITNALALALAIFLYVKLDELSSKVGSRRSDVVRSDTAGTADLEMRVAELEHASAARGHEPAATPDAPAHGAPSAPGGAAVHGGTDAPPLASPASEDAAAAALAAAAGETQELGPQEMQVFRKNVKRAIDLNDEEEQKNRVIDRLDELVKENRIAQLNPHQKEGVATTVLAYRKKIPDVWKKLRESGAFENTSREDQGKMFRSEFDALRADAQRSLEEFMPAADAKTYLDDSMRDAMRGFGGRAQGFGGRDGTQAPQAPGR